MDRLEEFVEELYREVEAYTDHDRGTIAEMGFIATIDQILFEKYGISRG